MHKGTINVGKYDDGSGFAVEVSFDTTSATAPNCIWFEIGSNNWIGIEEKFADELCRAIRMAAKAIRAATPPKENK